LTIFRIFVTVLVGCGTESENATYCQDSDKAMIGFDIAVIAVTIYGCLLGYSFERRARQQRRGKGSAW